MPITIKMLLDQYTEILRKIYGSHLKTVILYGSYARGDYKADSDIDIMILSKYQLELYDEIEIEDYLQKILSEYFSYDNLHFTFISEFNYPFSEILLISDDKIIFQEEEYLDYVLGYSAFKRDREALEVMREENLKDLESFRNGLL